MSDVDINLTVVNAVHLSLQRVGWSHYAGWDPIRGTTRTSGVYDRRNEKNPAGTLRVTQTGDGPLGVDMIIAPQLKVDRKTPSLQVLFILDEQEELEETWDITEASDGSWISTKDPNAWIERLNQGTDLWAFINHSGTRYSWGFDISGKPDFNSYPTKPPLFGQSSSDSAEDSS